MPEAERPDDLDRRIEAKDRGEEAAPDAELDALADAARALDAHWSCSPDVDADAIWASVETGIESTPQRGWRTWSRRFRARPLLLTRGLPAVAAALVLMIAVVAGALLTTSGTASARFLEEVEQLSAVVQESVADGTLDSDELAELNALAAQLLETVRSDPEALSDIDVDELKAAVSTLSAVVALIESRAETENGRVVQSLTALSHVSDVAHDALVEEVVANATDACSEIGGADLAACKQSLGAAEDICDELGEAAKDSCEEQIESLEEAVEAAVEAVEDAEGCDELTGADAQEACRTEVAAAFEAADLANCDNIGSEADLDGCKQAIDALEGACDGLSHAARETCEDDLDAIEDRAESALAAVVGDADLDEADDGDVDNADDGDADEADDGDADEADDGDADENDEGAASCGDLDSDAAATCAEAVASASAVCGEISSESDLDACRQSVDDAEEACDELADDARHACKEELGGIEDGAKDSLKASKEACDDLEDEDAEAACEKALDGDDGSGSEEERDDGDDGNHSGSNDDDDDDDGNSGDGDEDGDDEERRRRGRRRGRRRRGRRRGRRPELAARPQPQWARLAWPSSAARHLSSSSFEPGTATVTPSRRSTARASPTSGTTSARCCATPTAPRT